MPGLKLRWLAVCSSNSLTTVSWPLLAATLIALRPQWSEWFGSAPWFKSARTQCSCPSWAAIPASCILLSANVSHLVRFNHNLFWRNKAIVFLQLERLFIQSTLPRAVAPWLQVWSGVAPCSRSSLTIAACPCQAAEWSGVLFSLSQAFTLAPPSVSNNATISTCPCQALTWSDVLPCKT